MRKPFLSLLAIAVSAASFVLLPTGAEAETALDWANTNWRLELSAMSGLDSGRRDRAGDFTGNVVAELEIPFSSVSKSLERATLGLRLRPLFYWNEDSTDILGAGGGFGLRFYQHKDTLSGFYGEFAEEIIFHDEKFEGNSTNFNFMTQLGVGYQSKKNWFLTLRFQHMSNASLGDQNAGVNAIGMAGGFRF